ncbi:YopX family protein [Paenibacillus sp. D9]|uniref:YopX family protein n=1 Tax=Paenibacillus sp. D9 TaxID=665792 RepID=UPI000676524D|nr:YopX family protein [Paenibacillus sp. D9]
MGRDYKFRGRRIDNGEWVYGSLIGTDVIVGEIVVWNDEYFNTEFWYKVDPETVGQYIGLKDKNGLEIYERAEIRFPDACNASSECGEDWEETVGIGEVVWENDEARYVVTNRDSIGMDELFEAINEVEVIGSIHQHPELLREGDGS